jgi:hypothetical protein
MAASTWETKSTTRPLRTRRTRAATCIRAPSHSTRAPSSPGRTPYTTSASLLLLPSFWAVVELNYEQHDLCERRLSHRIHERPGCGESDSINNTPSFHLIYFAPPFLFFQPHSASSSKAARTVALPSPVQSLCVPVACLALICADKLETDRIIICCLTACLGPPSNDHLVSIGVMPSSSHASGCRRCVHI